MAEKYGQVVAAVLSLAQLWLLYCTVYTVQSSIELSDVQLALQNWRKEQKTPNMEHSDNRDSRAVPGNGFIKIVSTF